MKIQSINAVALANYTSFYKQTKLDQKNHLVQSPITSFELKDLTHNSSSINFMAKKPPINAAKCSLDDKLSALFYNHFSEGDAIVVGKNVQEVLTGLKNYANKIPVMLDRVMFIKDGGLSVPIAFVKLTSDFIYLYNIGNKDILVSRPNSINTLAAGEETFINQDDVIINNKRNILINFLANRLDFDLLKQTDSFFSFLKTKQETISMFNTKVLERLIEQEVSPSKDLQKKKVTTFSDVGGLDHVIEQIEKEIIFPVEFPYAYNNRKVNHGFLFYGPPGTGKTHLANALANEIHGKFIKLNGLEMVDSLLGQTEKNWRKLFAEAKANQPCVIFIDEIDAVAKKRSGKDVYGDQVVNQLLTLIGDLRTSGDKVFVIGATNMLENLDPAMIRAGRLSKLIEIPAPKKDGLRQIFDIQTKDIVMDSNIDKEALLDRFVKRNLTGADTDVIISDAQDNCWERLGIFNKMRNRTLSEDSMSNVKIIQADFDKAIEEYRPDKAKESRNPIGYRKL